MKTKNYKNFCNYLCLLFSNPFSTCLKLILHKANGKENSPGRCFHITDWRGGGECVDLCWGSRSLPGPEWERSEINNTSCPSSLWPSTGCGVQSHWQSHPRRRRRADSTGPVTLLILLMFYSQTTHYLQYMYSPLL